MNRKGKKSAILGPLTQQILALIITALGIITILAVFGVTKGRWATAWVDWLQYMLGWGVYPAAVTIVLAGLLWLQHHLDRPARWRWRPFVGAELVFFSLLALTHAAVGHSDLWNLVEENWGGGLVGWALSTLLSTYLGWPTTIVILLTMLALGLALAFDLTFEDVKQGVLNLQRRSQSLRSDLSAAMQQRKAQSTSQPPFNYHPGPSERDKREDASSRSQSSRSKTASTKSPQPSPRIHKATLPPLSLLNETKGPALTDQEVRHKSRVIQKTLAQFGVPVEVIEVRVGPTVTQFGVEPGFVERPRAGERKIRVRQISTLADDLALALASPRLRVEAPVPGRPYVGIEVPNTNVQVVGVREVMASDEFRKLESPLAIALGNNVSGDPIVADLTRMPHLLIAGTTGSGKSVCIKSIITCLVYNNTPDELRMVMIDPKMVELVRFNGLPHLYGEVEVDLDRVVKVLRWVALEMDNRYKRFADLSARNLDDYNRKMAKRSKQKHGEAPMPRLVVLIDELADLMMLAPDAVENMLCRIAQMGRATGIHLVVATQRPSTDVVTGLIKANFPARISFATTSQVDSRVILDMQGAETLLGDGDMLYVAPDAGYPVRVQGCFVSEEELDRVVGFWRREASADSVEAVVDEAESPWAGMMPPEMPDGIEDDYVEDDMLQQAIDLVKDEDSASASLLQRRLRIGHPRAARLMEVLEEMEIIGPPVEGGRTRVVIIGGDEE